MAGFPFITYDSSTKTYRVAPGATTANIESTIQGAQAGSTVLLSAGRYRL